MKKIISLMLVLLAMCTSMTSCSNDDDNEPSSNSIVGTWVYVDDDNDYFEMVIFTKNGEFAYSFSHDYGTEEFYGEYEIEGDEIIIKYEDGDSDEIRYSMPDKDTLILYDSDGDMYRYERYEDE